MEGSVGEVLLAVQSNVIMIACGNKREKLPVAFFSYYALDEWRNHLRRQLEETASPGTKNRIRKVRLNAVRYSWS